MQPLNDVDVLSAPARAILSIDAANRYTRLVVTDTPADPSPAKAAIEALSPTGILNVPVARPADAEAIVSGLWLWHDYLDRSHRISQKIETPTGSFWHAIMHRREGDFSNSKYWNARCRGHAVYDYLAAKVGSVVGELPVDKAVLRITKNGWDADAFVDLVERVHRDERDPRHAAAVTLQRIEWQLLFDHSIRGAAGR